MSRLHGVEQYVVKTYKAQQTLMQEIERRVRMVLGNSESTELLELIRDLSRTSADLGSMRRLLGDLRVEEARQGQIDPR